MRELKSLSTHLIHQIIQETPAARREEVLEHVLIYFPEVTEVYGDVNALYIISDIAPESDGHYSITYWNAGGYDRQVIVGAEFPLMHFFF